MAQEFDTFVLKNPQITDEQLTQELSKNTTGIHVFAKKGMLYKSMDGAGESPIGQRLSRAKFTLDSTEAAIIAAARPIIQE